jgi:hypothetical protein
MKMTDIVVRLRCDAGEFFMRYGDTLLTEAADEIVALREELNDATLEQSWAERNAAVAELHNHKETSQAREAKLRDALSSIVEVTYIEHQDGCATIIAADIPPSAKEALAMPADDTALKELHECCSDLDRVKVEKEHYIKVWSNVCDENQGLLNEIERLREALDLLWANANHEEWDAMAREHFERLIRGWK